VEGTYRAWRWVKIKKKMGVNCGTSRECAGGWGAEKGVKEEKEKTMKARIIGNREQKLTRIRREFRVERTGI
jgi:hypothetical protein